MPKEIAMLCAERIQRIVQAFILGIALLFVGYKLYAAAFGIVVAMMFMLFFAGVTGFCPGLKLLKQFFPSCDTKD